MKQIFIIRGNVYVADQKIEELIMSIKVKIFCTNEFYGFINTEENTVITNVPNNWKTETAAKRWAEENGYIVIENYTPYDKNRLKELKENYYIAKAEYILVKEKTEEIQTAILANNVFYRENKWQEDGKKEKERILDPFKDFLMSDEDFIKYLDMCFEEYKKAGIADSRGKEYLPETEPLARCIKAEDSLILYSIDILPDGILQKAVLRKNIHNPKYRETMLDLILRLRCGN